MYSKLTLAIKSPSISIANKEPFKERQLRHFDYMAQKTS